MTHAVKFRKLHRPPPLDLNTLKDSIRPGEGLEWTKRGENTWIHAKGVIEYSKKLGYTATIHRTIRGERTTMVLYGGSLGTAAAWIETH